MRIAYFAAAVQVILFLAHWLIYATLVRFLGIGHPAKLLGLRIGLGLLSISFVFASFLSFRSAAPVTRWVYTLAASWLGITYLLVLASLAAWIVYAIGGVLHPGINRR